MVKKKLIREYTDWKDIDNFLKDCKNNRVVKRTRNLNYLFLNASKTSFESDFSNFAYSESYVFSEQCKSIVDVFIDWWNAQNKINYWVGISGSWRNINEGVVEDTSEVVRYIINKNMGILTGGALGVDYIATEAVLKYGEPEKHLRIVLPIDRNVYMTYLTNVTLDGKKIDRTQADFLTNQLREIDSLYSGIIFDRSPVDEGRFMMADDEDRKKIYHFRNSFIGYGCDGLAAFWVNQTKGVEDAIKKVKFMKKPVFVRKYEIDEDSEDIIRDYQLLKYS